MIKIGVRGLRFDASTGLLDAADPLFLYSYGPCSSRRRFAARRTKFSFFLSTFISVPADPRDPELGLQKMDGWMCTCVET